MSRRFLTSFFALFLSGWSIVLPQTVHVAVEAGTIVTSINPWLYGINTARWDESLFPGPASEMLTTADRDAIGKIKASGITLLKYPGGNDADAYVWNAKSNNASEMDTDEYIELCRAVGAEPFITVNFNEPPELAAAWVRYCNVEKGYSVKLWEVGDEQWGTWARGHVPPEQYAKKYINFVKAMRAVDPSIKVATNVPLGLHPENWAERVMKAAGDYIDMITFTYFPQPSGKENDDTLMTTVATYRKLYSQLRTDIERAVGREKAASILYVNVGYNSVSHSPGLQTIQVINALWTADMLGSMAELRTDIACFWALHNFYPPRGGDYGYLSSEGSNTPRFSYYVFPLMAEHFKGNVVKATCDDRGLSTYASKSGKELSVVFINKKRGTSTNVEVQLSGFKPRANASVWVLDEKRHNTPLQDLKNVSDKFSVKLPPYSITALKIIGQDSVLQSADIARLATPSASSFSTIGPHFKPVSAIDGKSYTRWNSAAWTKSNGQEQQWFQLAWKSPQTIKHVRITWGETFAVHYQLQSSLDGKKWSTMREVTSGTGGIDECDIPPVKARYLRIDGKKGTKGISAYSIREISVFGEQAN
ncbi:MAG: discoidin domain-containing protein [Ignavibacteriales bacterium]|nr:discoidin domain-containing protein [Ignavibacteriales bacterium]